MRNSLLLLAAALALAACGEKSPQATSGRGLYEALNCRVCHVIEAEGARGGPDLTMVGFRHNEDWLETFLKDPAAWRAETMMPNPRLSAENRKALAGYLASLRGQDFGGKMPWDEPRLKIDPIKRGHVIYARAGCIACHGKGGAGGYPNNNVKGGKIPSVNNVAETFTKTELLLKIRAGVTPQKDDPKGPEPLVEMPGWGKVLREDELAAVADYLLSLKAGGAPKSDW